MAVTFFKSEKGMKNHLLLLATLSLSAAAQQPVAVGSGSYAEYTPLCKSKTDAHNGDKSRYMENRRIYMADSKAGEPIPTNDWWTNLLVDTYSGILWTYPQVVCAEGDGIYVAHPSHWSSDGCEMKYDTRITVKGRKFHPANAIADDWSDWGLRMQLADGDKAMNVTMVQGSPFTWVEATGLDLVVDLGGGVADCSTDGRVVITNGSDIYALYGATGTVFEETADGIAVTFAPSKPHYIAVAVLPSADYADEFARYAPVIVRSTTTSWNYNERTAMMTSTWTLTTENLDGASNLDALQGFLPHHYKNSANNIPFLDYAYATPRGKMKMAAGREFTTAYKFDGFLPWYAAPKEMADLANPYNRERMRQMISDYATKGSFGADTYWGGKGLTQMALYMTFAKEMGEEELFEQCRSRLRESLEDWLTYTPGETQRFFARYDRWGALVGYDTSYDSDTFNDHHFHYGYYTYAGALLALVDDDFRQKYGGMLKLIAKDYANWDRSDKRFPWLRTFSPWSGHSYAGGLGNTGNGNGQESTSEAMQGWGGVYLLGVALGDKEMRDAGIFGWVTESKGVAEYWFDRDKENIDRTLYTHPYCSNLTAAGVGWWTWFSGDPVWMHSIQWMPISPCLDYLSEDLDFAKWDYEQMWSAKEIGGWTTTTSSESTLSQETGLGNVVLSYLQRYDPDQAAKIMDEMWDANMAVARETDTNGISYFITHSHRSYGDRDFACTADIPTASAFCTADGVYTYVAYNADAVERTVTFYRDGAAVKQFKAPARQMTVYSDGPVATGITIDCPSTVAPGSTTAVTAAVLDQYGATVDNATVTWTATDGSTIDANGNLTASAEKGSTTLTAVCGSLTATKTVRVNELPVLASAEITPAMDYAMAGQTVEFSLNAVDQYGEAYATATTWTIERDGVTVKTDSILNLNEIGVYTVTATTADGHSYSHRIYMTPAMPNLALNKPVTASSEENTGTVKANAVDGDASTRWSSAVNDDEWIMVDLEKVAYINSVNILWENAYASLYDVETSLDGTAWTKVKTVTGSGGEESTAVGSTARYVRITGRQRATAYGISMWELQVLGIDPDADPSSLMGISINAPTTIVKAGEQITLSATGFDLQGNKIDAGEVVWSADSGTVTADGVFTPAGYGTATVTATSGGFSATKKFVVEEQIVATSATISPTVAQIVIGEQLDFSISATDQFSTDFPTDGFSLSCAEMPDAVSGTTFTATKAGTYTVTASNGTVSASAKVTVGTYDDTNLALGKSVYASSYENSGTVPANAVDGDSSTRWGSEFTDNQYIVVDLGAEYVLSRAEIEWNADAYAIDYRVEVSKDDDEWTTVATETASTGGTRCHSFTAAGRYVRVFCLSRYNAYGSCINELKVYGTAKRIDPKPTSVSLSASDGKAVFVGTPVQMSATVTDQYGIDCTTEFDVDWSVDGDCAAIDSDGLLTPTSVGECTVTASCEGVSDSRMLRVLDGSTLSLLAIEPALVEMEVGSSHALSIVTRDQYGNAVDCSDAAVTYADGITVADGEVTATTAGSYTITAQFGGLTATAEMRVLDSLTDNLALGKTATASAGTSSIASVNDGNTGTRWIADNAAETDAVTLTIDLADTYHLLRSNVLWERAAAADYTVEGSLDGETWQTLHSEAGYSDTGADRTDASTLDAIARYVRLSMTRRATAWAYSIYEWQLFGRMLGDDEPCSVEIANLPDEVNVGDSVTLEAVVKNSNGEVIDWPVSWSATGGTVSGNDYRSDLTGSFAVTATAELAKASAPVSVVYKTSSIADVVATAEISCIDGTLSVRANGLTHVTVYSLSGAVMVSEHADGTWHKRLSLPRGAYVVVATTANGKTARKIML